MNPSAQGQTKNISYSLYGKPSTPPPTLRSQLVGGSLTLLAGSGLASVTNFLYNVATARLLGPSGFAHATAVYTMLMLMSAITLSYQVVCAKYVARLKLPEERAEIFATLHHRSWITGVGIAALLVLFRRLTAEYLNLPDSNLVTLLALGTAFYIPLGVRRGYIQGVHAFRPLAVNFLLEGVVRLGGVFILINIGMGVQGAVLASVLAVITSYFFALPSPGIKAFRLDPIVNSFHEGLQAIVFFSGQMIITNFDIVLVKHFFAAEEAGFYAAVGLVGRLINMCAWSVVNAMFPVSAGRSSDAKESRSVLVISLVLVIGILAVLIGGLYLIPNFLWRTIFGAHFQTGGFGSLREFLILYATTAGVYSLSSVIITHEMARKVANTSWVQLAFSGIFIAGVCLFHDNLQQVILIRLVLMLALLAVLVIPSLLDELPESQAIRDYRRIRLLRRLSEEEVIAEFLRSEFHYPEFDEYRPAFANLVARPDLGNPRENELRRALLFLRRGAMWRELPDDTTWFAVGLAAKDLSRIRFFPRAQWRRIAKGNFYLPRVIERIRTELRNPGEDEFLNKLRRLSASVRGGVINPTVLLIGVSATSPLTILDGNHRVAAAMLAQPSALFARYRFICGFSPRMTRCCWYDTNLNTLFRYFGNLVRHFSYDPESDIDRYQQKDSGVELPAQAQSPDSGL
jgi:O-antigen/teichoic acid export membrane protein